jgi:polysaccharide biosynthesis protein PslH
MVPRSEAPWAIPLVLDARVAGVRSLGHELTLITIARSDPADREAVAELSASGVDVHPVYHRQGGRAYHWRNRWRLASTWLMRETPFRSAWFWEAGVQTTLDRLLSTAHFDVVLLEDNAAGLYTVPNGVPTLLTDYEVRRPRKLRWRELVHARQPHHWLLRELDWQRWHPYQRRVWSRAHSIQVFSNRDARVIGEIAPELSARTHVNPFGVRLPSVPADPAAEDGSSILFVGNFTHPPNLDGVLWLAREILPRVRQLHPGVKLVIVGSSPPASVRALVGDGVELHESVPEIRPYLERASALVAPLRTGGGQRMKVLYAMALGKAVVTTPRGADGLAVVGHEPPLVTAQDSESLARATAELLASPEKRCDLATRARAYVNEHYSPLAHARRQEAAIELALRRSFQPAQCDRAPHALVAAHGSDAAHSPAHER